MNAAGDMASTICVRLMPSGRGAVATVLVAGPAAIEIVGRIFQPAGSVPWKQTEVRIIRFGRWNGEQGEEIVVARTADDRVEIHCHGGEAAASAIVSELSQRGCGEVEWQSWLAADSTDRLAADAAIALASATTERAAAILLTQHQGALRRAITQFLGSLESEAIAAASEQIAGLLARAPVGLHLVEPWRVVIAGRPNVGKSSLLNALLGYQRAIVDDTAGTTRDVVTAQTAFDGWPVELCDTAGLRSDADRLESLGIERAKESVAAADLVLLVEEAQSAWSAEALALAHFGPPAILVLNKSDLIDLNTTPISDGAIAVSALTGMGLDVLSNAIARRLVPTPPAADEAVPFLPDHVEALLAAQSALRQADVAAAVARLQTLLTADIALRASSFPSP